MPFEEIYTFGDYRFEIGKDSLGIEKIRPKADAKIWEFPYQRTQVSIIQTPLLNKAAIAGALFFALLPLLQVATHILCAVDLLILEAPFVGFWLPISALSLTSAGLCFYFLRKVIACRTRLTIQSPTSSFQLDYTHPLKNHIIKRFLELLSLKISIQAHQPE